MSTLFTLGYQGADIGAFVTTLQEAGVRLLLDIRELPLSRKKGFSKRALAQALADGGIAYRHLRDLGNPKPGRDAAHRGDRATFERVFRNQLRSENAQRALDCATELALHQPACLLCFERDEAGCHRRIVADAMAARSSLRIEHLRVG